nr:MAG TPA: hypothetical protein [Caudoviricetes sp.]
MLLNISVFSVYTKLETDSSCRILLIIRLTYVTAIFLKRTKSVPKNFNNFFIIKNKLNILNIFIFLCVF